MMQISPYHEAFYIDSMLFNTASALGSVEVVADMIEALGGGELARTDLDQDELLDHLQNVVLQAGALSRYFWPARGTYEERGRLLRGAFSVTEASPLKNRDLRNALEHFDERLDLYLQRNIVGFILPRYVGPSVSTDGIPAHVFRAYFTDRGVFALLGEEYEIQPIVDELARVHDLLVDAVSDGNRLPRGENQPRAIDEDSWQDRDSP